MHTIPVNYVTYNNKTFAASHRAMRQDYSFFAIKDFKFLDVVTQHRVEQKAIGHGYYDGQVQITQRPIELTIGCFTHSRQERLHKIKQLEQIFSVPSNPSEENDGYRLLTFEEPTGKKREMQAKVVRRNNYSDYDNENRVGVKVRLLPKNDACMYSDEHILHDQNRIMGAILGQPLGFPFWYENAVQINYQGVSEASVNMKITALTDNPCNEYLLVRAIRNDGTHTLLWLENIMMKTGDELCIDSISGVITLNGFDITGSIKLPFFEFPTLKNLEVSSGVGSILLNNLLAVDCENPHKVLNVEYSWRDTRC